MDSPIYPALTPRAAKVDGYESPRLDLHEHIPTTARRILEFGCSTGALGAAIKARQGATVHGVEIDPEYAADAARKLDVVANASVEDFLATAEAATPGHDCLICADVLEHLVDPVGALREARRLLAPEASVIISIPNVLYWPEFRRVLKGDWPQEDEGIFDRTHLRWFTPATARALAENAGLKDVTVIPIEWGMARRHRAISAGLKLVGLQRFTPAQLVVLARNPGADPGPPHDVA